MTLAAITQRRAKKTNLVGPDHDGRQMSLSVFGRCDFVEGYSYELGRGVLEVSGVPNIQHGDILDYLRGVIEVYRHQNPKAVRYVAGGMEAKISLFDLKSERHPDLSIYRTAPPAGKQPWPDWVPEIVIEVVSDSSRVRDYEMKPAEYLAFGVMAYWVIDPREKAVVVHSRVAGSFQVATIRANAKFETFLLPGFKLNLKKLFAARR